MNEPPAPAHPPPRQAGAHPAGRVADDRAGSAWDRGPGLLASVWRYRWIVALSTAMIGASVYGLSLLLQPTQYEAEARLFLRDPSGPGASAEAMPAAEHPERYVRNQAELAQSRPVRARVVERLDSARSPRELAERVTVESDADLDLLTIAARAPTPSEAAQLANAMADSYEDVMVEEVRGRVRETVDRLDAEAGKLEERISELNDRVEQGADGAVAEERDAAIAELVRLEQRSRQLSLDAELFGSGVDLHEQAELPREPAQPQPLRNGATASLLGLIAVGGFAWWRAGERQRAERPQDPAPVLGAPLLGDVPDFAAVGTGDTGPGAVAQHTVLGESYRFVLWAIDHALGEVGRDTGALVLVTSPVAADGKTTTAVNVAAAADAAGRQPLLVDADVQAAGLSHLAGITDEPGLSELGDTAVPAEWCVRAWRAERGPELAVVPRGSAGWESADFARSVALRTAMTRLRERVGLAFIDAPPLLPVADASALAAHVDGIVLVVNRGVLMQTLEDVRARLSFVGTPLLGYVFNRAHPRRSFRGYYGRSAPRQPDGNGASPASSDAARAPAG